MKTITRIVLFFSIFICKLSYAQTDFQSLLVNDKDFSGFSDYYYNNTLDDLDETMVIRMTVDSLIRYNKIEKVIFKPKGSSKTGYSVHTYDSCGNRLFDKGKPFKKQILKKEIDTLGRITIIEKESFKYYTEIERYEYDNKGRLVEISSVLKPVPRDTGDVVSISLICLSLPNKWRGEYDETGNLISSETYWDNGKVYKQEYKYVSGQLIMVIYDSLDNKKITKKYFYNKGLPESILYFNKKGRKIKTEKFVWEIIIKG